MTDSKTTMQKLQEPFKESDLEWRVGSTTADKTKGLALVYVTNRAIQNRLDDVFGPFGWQNTFREWKGNSQLCGISVKFDGEWITKWDGADDSATEAVKGGLSDSMKRAAYQWGIGRYLYDFPQQWCKLKAQGKSFVLAENPTIPSWALPNGAHTNTPTPTQKPTTSQSVKSNNDIHLVSKGQIAFISKKLKDAGLDPNTQCQIRFKKDLVQLTVDEGNQLTKELKSA